MIGYSQLTTEGGSKREKGFYTGSTEVNDKMKIQDEKEERNKGRTDR